MAKCSQFDCDHIAIGGFLEQRESGTDGSGELVAVSRTLWCGEHESLLGRQMRLRQGRSLTLRELYT